MIINLFCDASIDNDKRIACAGCYEIFQDINGPAPIGEKYLIQYNATNNSAEILAIWIGITEALRLRNIYPNAIFRLFSDSKISLYGLRDWMKNWISNSQRLNSNTLINSAGSEVANQQWFIYIYNTIVLHNLSIEFYHQRGHVGEGKVSMDRARISFIKANKVSPENTGLGIEYISECNKVVDNNSRYLLKLFIESNTLGQNAEIVMQDPMHHIIRADQLSRYIRFINKTSVVSRHDFKGGYNQ